MTQEEAERRKTEEIGRQGDQAIPAQSEDQGQASSSGPNPDNETSVLSPVLSPDVEKTMRKAQKQTDKATPSDKGRSGSEEEKPDRTLRTAEEVRSNALLPVVQEAGEGGDQNEKHDPMAANGEGLNVDDVSKAPTTRSSSIPALRKVSPSTIGTATDLGDETSMSSPQAGDFEPDSQFGRDRESIPDHVLDREYEKPPRIGSDLIKPQSPLGENFFESLNQHVEPGK